MTAPDYTELREDWLRNLRLETSGASLCEIEAIAIGGAVLKLSDLLTLLEHDDTAIAELQAQVEVMWAVIQLVEDAMMRGGDGKILGMGWNITKLNKARPAIHAALQPKDQTPCAE
jgi:hypothetical protein